ncbi:MAG: ABC transporter ATP-binding protein [Treponema sp.]|nr:ABC transporter ATP-binding protein [Treponema sp.]
MLSIQSLKKKLGSFSLSIDNLSIEKPGIYGLIGPNGSGKSTAAKIISGILAPDSGEISTDMDSRSVTMLTQKPFIIDDTVYKNIEYPLYLRGTVDRKPLCDEYLKKIGFLDRKNQKARGLSGGEKQKLALVRAMIFNPQLIILDESMSELDLDSLDLFEGMILERQRQNPVIWIIISHQLALIRRLCGYIFFMADGRLEAEGPTEELLRSDNPSIIRYLKHEGAQLRETADR